MTSCNNGGSCVFYAVTSSNNRGAVFSVRGRCRSFITDKENRLLDLWATDKWLTNSDKRQTRPLVREGAPIGQDSDFHTRINIWSWAPEGPRHQDGLTDWPSVATWLWLWLWLTWLEFRSSKGTAVRPEEELEDLMCDVTFAVVHRYGKCVIWWDFYSSAVINPLPGKR
jgi:hypothetical protein